MTVKTGFKQDLKGSWIPKDPNAQLVYSLDWAARWLPQGASLQSVNFTVETINNDPAPLTIQSQGIQQGITYVELSGGTANNVYTVTCNIVTDDGATDSRRFQIKCEERFV
jgi:hypothetical protein